MIITYQKVLRLPLMELKNQTRLGEVKEVVFNKTNFNIAGFLIKTKGLSLSNKRHTISASEVVELSNQAVIINDEKGLTDLRETIRIREALNEGYSGIGQVVYTKSGKRLGKVIDLFIDSERLFIVKIIIKGIFSERLVPINHILEVKGKKIIIRDDFEVSKNTFPTLASKMV